MMGSDSIQVTLRSSTLYILLYFFDSSSHFASKTSSKLNANRSHTFKALHKYMGSATTEGLGRSERVALLLVLRLQPLKGDVRESRELSSFLPGPGFTHERVWMTELAG